MNRVKYWCSNCGGVYYKTEYQDNMICQPCIDAGVTVDKLNKRRHKIFPIDFNEVDTGINGKQHTRSWISVGQCMPIVGMVGNFIYKDGLIKVRTVKGKIYLAVLKQNTLGIGVYVKLVKSEGSLISSGIIKDDVMFWRFKYGL